MHIRAIWVVCSLQSSRLCGQLMTAEFQQDVQFLRIISFEILATNTLRITVISTMPMVNITALLLFLGIIFPQVENRGQPEIL